MRINGYGVHLLSSYGTRYLIRYQIMRACQMHSMIEKAEEYVQNIKPKSMCRISKSKEQLPCD